MNNTIKNMSLLALLFLTLFTTSPLYATIAAPSLFPGMRSVNPAVVGGRKAAYVSAIGDIQKIEKIQTLSTDLGFHIDGVDESKIDLQGVNFFYGGKGGDLVTLEIFTDVTQGKREKTISSDSENVFSENDLSSKYLNITASIGDYIGVRAGYYKYEYEDQMSGTIGGQPFSSDANIGATDTIIGVGVRSEISVFTLGAFLNYSTIKSDTQVGGDGADTATGTGKNSVSEKEIGAAIGFKTKSLNIEFGHEMKLSDDETSESMSGNKLNPSRSSLSIELALNGLSLGYTARYYIDGFSDIEHTVENVLVYSSDDPEPRLEHIVNFALGSSKGFSISGSASYSKVDTKESNSLYKTGGGPYPTEVKSIGASVQIGYEF